MAIAVTRLTPHFAARVEGVDITRPVPPEGGATEFASTRDRRLMQRTTVSGDPADLVPAAR